MRTFKLETRAHRPMIMEFLPIHADPKRGSWEQASAPSIMIGLGLGLASLCFVACFKSFSTKHRYSIPRVGMAPGWLSAKSAKADFIVNGARIIDDGYRMVSDSCRDPCHQFVLFLV